MSRKWLPVVLAGFVACNPTGPEGPLLELEATIVVSPENGPSTPVSFTIGNIGDIPVRYLPCNHVVQRLDDREWVGVWSPGCLLSGTFDVELLPGSERTDTLWVNLAFASDESLESTHRVGTYIFWRAGEGDFATTPLVASITP